MKTTRLYGLLTMLSITFFIGCSSSSEGEDPENGGVTGGGGTTPTVSSIVLTADKSSLDVGQTITFTVKTNLGTDVTSSAAIKVNGTAITGNTYSPTTDGNYTAKATYQTFTSSNLAFTANEVVAGVTVTSVEVTADQSSIDVGNTVEFTSTVTYSDGAVVDKTAESVFSVNGSDIVGNKYIGAEVGTASISATFDDTASSPITVQVNQVSTPSTFTQKAVIEDYTGTWCGWCPRVSYAIELVENQTDKAFVVAAHLANGDPMENDASLALRQAFGVNSFPTAYVNRDAVWTSPEPSNVNQVTNAASGTTNVGLAVNAIVSNQTMQVVVSTGFGQSINGAKLVVFVLEDGISYNQANYTSYYGGASTLSNFEHNHVLRYSATDVLGDPITNSAGVHHKAYTINLGFSATIADPLKTGVLAMIVDSTGKKVLNAQYTSANSDKDFD